MTELVYENPMFNMHVNKLSMRISDFSIESQQKLNARLAKGLDLYGWKHVVEKNGEQICFVVANDCIGGRGLRFANWVPMPKGKYITRAPGTIVKSWTLPGCKRFKWVISKPTKEKPGSYLILDPPTWNALGNVINTSDGTRPNNCRLQYRPGNSYLSVITTRILHPGDEMLVPYGQLLTGEIHSLRRLQDSVHANDI